MQERMLLTAIGLVTLVGCSDRATEPSESLALPATVAASGLPLTGYVHEFSRSKFRLGKIVGYVSEFGMSKTVGEEGVFAIDERNGSALGVPNGDAPALAKKPLTLSAEDHNNRVVAYFEDAGIPKEQVSGVHVTTSMRGVAHQIDDGVEPGPNTEKGELEGFQSVLERSVEGIPVPDSFAWARFDEDDEVVWENVHWPPISSDVVRAAHAFQTALANPQAVDAFVSAAGLPVDTVPRVVIRHSTFAVEGPVTAMASVDAYVSVPLGKSRIDHFDLSGRTLALPPDAPMRPADIRK